MNKNFCVRETVEWIKLGDEKDSISFTEFKLLDKFIKKNIISELPIIEVKYNKIRFVNYVGIISVCNVTIEILPKISLEKNSSLERKVLLRMLSKSKDISLSIFHSLDTQYNNYNLLELIADRFLTEMLLQTNKGLYYEYVTVEENLSLIKGRIKIEENIKLNYSNKIKSYCEFTEYSSNNVLNQILKLAILKVFRCIKKDNIEKKCKRLLSQYYLVNNIRYNKIVIESFNINKQSKRFNDALILAKFILSNKINETTVGTNNGFAMMFEINTLFEEYIANLVKEIWNEENEKVIVQDKRMYLASLIPKNWNAFNLKPDIVLKKNDIEIIIIDTKWKQILRENKLNYKKEDIYQLTVYATQYRNCSRLILLYPYIKDRDYPKWKLNLNNYPILEVHTVRLDNEQHTKRDLFEIIRKKSFSV